MCRKLIYQLVTLTALAVGFAFVGTPTAQAQQEFTVIIPNGDNTIDPTHIPDDSCTPSDLSWLLGEISHYAIYQAEFISPSNIGYYHEPIQAVMYGSTFDPQNPAQDCLKPGIASLKLEFIAPQKITLETLVVFIGAPGEYSVLNSNVTLTPYVPSSPNTPPTATADEFGLEEDMTLNVTKSILGNDSDNEDGTPETAVKKSDPQDGQLALNTDGTFTYTPDADFNGTDSFTYAAKDSSGLESDPVTVTLNVTAVNDAPSLTVDKLNEITEDLGAETINRFVNSSKAGPDNESGQTVSFEASADDETFFSALPAISSDGDLTFTVAENKNGTTLIRVRAVDDGGTDNEGEDASEWIEVSLTVIGLNDAPVAVADSYETVANQTLNGSSVLANDTDIDEYDEVTRADLRSDVSHGTLNFNQDGTFTYTPDTDYEGEDSFTYIAYDYDSKSSNTVTVTIQVLPPVNDPPVAVDDTVSVDEDGEVTFNVVDNDTDTEGPVADAINPSSVGHGQLANNGNGSFTYTPDTDYEGEDSFTYTARDGEGADSENTATVTITVNSINDAPVAKDDTYTVVSNEPLNGSVLDNDFDVEESAAMLVAVQDTDVSHGTLNFKPDGTFTYTSDTDYEGEDSFTYHVEDREQAVSNTATVTIQVSPPVNDPPVAVDDAYSIDEDNTLVVSNVFSFGNAAVPQDNLGQSSLDFNPDDLPANDPFDDNTLGDDTLVDFEDNLESPNANSVLGNDTDTEDDTPTTAVLQNDVSDGTLDLNADGSFTYTPDAHFFGIDSFTYFAQDSSGAQSASAATVRITVNSVNDKPVAVDDTYETAANEPLNGSVLDNDSDVEENAAMLMAVQDTDVSHGTLNFNQDGTFIYTPDTDYEGEDSFTYHVEDIESAASNTATVTITVEPGETDGTDTVGVFYPSTGVWYLRDENNSGVSTIPSFSYGKGGTPVAGDWNGDGTDTVGVFYPSTGVWYLRDENGAGGASVTPFTYGKGGTPVVGDWNNDGADTVGVFYPSTGTWYLRDENSAGGASVTPFTYGKGGTPVVGDWNSDGTDTVGVFYPSTGTWYLRDENSAGGASVTPFTYGKGGTPVVGDWNNDGTDTVGVFYPATGTWYLRDDNSAGNPSITPFDYGKGGTPVVGDWNNDGADTVGVFYPSTGTWYLRDENSAGGASVTPFTYGKGGTPVVGNWDGDSGLTSASVPAGIAALTVVNADTGALVTVLELGAVIQRQDLPQNVQLVAEAYGGDTVVFDYQGVATFQTDTEAPFTLTGDNPTALADGVHMLTATLYDAGAVVDTMTITFTIE